MSKLLDVQRLRTEVKEIMASEEMAAIGIKISPLSNDIRLEKLALNTIKFGTSFDITKLNCNITGPPGTPYQGGVFRLSIEIPDRYPSKPPKCGPPTIRIRLLAASRSQVAHDSILLYTNNHLFYAKANELQIGGRVNLPYKNVFLLK